MSSFRPKNQRIFLRLFSYEIFAMFVIKKNYMTDSGGFQMVSLLKLAQITEEGVKFTSPYDNSEMNMTPEHSMEIQVSMR